MELMASKHLFYIFAAYGYGIAFLSFVLISIIWQRKKLRAIAQVIKGEPR